jgi:hypothetical protein
MRKPQGLLVALVVAALAPLAWAQNSQSQANQRAGSEARGQTAPRNANSSKQSGNQAQAADIQAGTQVSAELLTTLDAHKLRPGKRVVARVTKDVKQNGRTVIHKGARLLGSVTSVQAAGNGQAGSQVGVQFDRLVQGHAVSQLNTVVTAVFARPQPMPMPMSQEPPMAAPMPAAGGGGGGGGLLGGAVSTVGSAAGSTVGEVGGTAGGLGGAASSQTSAGARNNAGLGAPLANVIVGSQSSAGAQNNAALAAPLGKATAGSSAEANQQTQASLFTSKKGNLRLDSGTQMELQVAGQAQAKPQAQPQPPPKH